MANICHNSLVITGDRNVIESIVDKLVVDKYIVFSNLIPVPSEIELKRLNITKSEWCEQWYEVDTDFGN